MSFRFLRCFFLLPVLSTGLLACQPDTPAETPAGPPVAPALSDSLDYDSLDAPLAATPVKRDWHRVARPTARHAPLVVYRASRPPQDETPPPPAEPRLQDLTLRPSEYFQIDPTKAAEVRGQDGTVVRFPAGALVDARQQPVTGTVWVELKECYSGPAMLLSNLLTETESGRPLELSGAVLVRASAQGRQLALATGRNFQLELKGRTHDNPLFYGQSGADGVVRWAAGEATSAAPTQVLTSAQRMPRYGNDIVDFNKLIRYPRQAQENQTEGVVFASFVVDESGRIQQPRILRGIGDGCDEEVLRVLRQTSGRWTPGQQDGRFVKVKMMLPIRFKFQPGQAIPTDVEPPTASDIAEASPEPAPEDTGLAAAPNALQPSRLGWLAAGRAWAGKAAPLFVPAFVANAETAVRLLVPGRRVVLAAAPQQGGYQFMNAPAGATVVGLRYENGAPFLARQPTPAGAPPDTLRFQETTLAELETTLSRLN
ncbi:energy transducer TonB [Hymenobacter actinosclerus]|uniref:TonB family C-terminal domain-containing protein n=1 Tax=Hymenobacter actinosclerus TaxID=82805 RepID=A0A1I0I7P9_9BACT|nr:energy transducer TonB [Hymenobacter actinosclerus]SET92737.1 TonB family C-terminal domain-containing protein [Hymenobacter actinosclerus]